MRLAMLDVGSRTVHLLVVDAEAGAKPQPAAKQRTELGLLDLLDGADHLSPDGLERLVSTVAEARRTATGMGVDDLAAFATSALREAANAEDVAATVRKRTGVDLHILAGEDEARLTFLAARRWHGWSAGRLLLLDIGGGSLEVAVGINEVPEHVASFPLGASRLTRDWFEEDESTLDDLRDHVRAVVEEGTEHLRFGDVDLAVGTSKTFRSLARIAGAAPYKDGPYVRRSMTRDQAATILDKVAGMKPKDRAKLPGVSTSRAPHVLAGAVVAVTAMEVLDVDEVVICPWALREGVILTRLDWLEEL